MSTVVDVVLFGAALWVLRRVLTEYDLADVLGAVGSIGRWPVVLAVAITALGYAALVGYDYLALRLVGRPTPVRDMWVPSFISFAVSNSAPIAIVTGGGIRYRLYSAIGLTAAETAAVTAFNVVTYVLGLFTVAGIAFLFAPPPVPGGLHLPVDSLRPVGALFLLLVGALVLAAHLRPGRLRVWRWHLDLPGTRGLLTQLAVSAADWLLSSGALYVLLLGGGRVSYLHFLSAFLLAQIVTQVVPLPGGIGVFEAVVLLLRPAGADAAVTTAALLLYRVVYYLLPLLAAGGLLAWQQRRTTGHALPAPYRRLARLLAPHLFAVLTLVAGGFLLLTGALPTGAGRLAWLGRTLPLAVIEASHFLGSMVGAALLLLALGLERRLRSAWRLTVALLALGIPLALARGLDVAAAAVLAALLMVLVPARRAFTRRSPLTTEPLGAGWIVAPLLILASVAWLGFFAYRHVEYSGELWWRFALDQNAPRALRAGVGVAVVLVIYLGFGLVEAARRPAGRGRARARRRERARVGDVRNR